MAPLAPIAYATTYEPRSSYEYSASVQAPDYQNYLSVKSIDNSHIQPIVYSAPTLVKTISPIVHQERTILTAAPAPAPIPVLKTIEPSLLKPVLAAPQPLIAGKFNFFTSGFRAI